MSGIFIAEDRNYSAWHIKGNTLSCTFDPVTSRALTGDTVDENGSVIESSPIRSDNNIPGVLSLTGSTYGRHKNKFLYKCIPANSQIPSFLIPYDASKKNVEKLSNISSNLYVLFKFKHWNAKHPVGELVEVLGPVSDISAFGLYQMHIKNLQYPRKTYQAHIKKQLANWRLKDIDPIEYVTSQVKDIQDRTKKKAITIDPNDTVDFDDALSCEDINYGETIVSVYIANVPVWLNVLQCWKQLPPTPATIYLPNSKYSMFPSVLSDNLFSLIENKERIAIGMDVIMSKYGIVQSVSFAPCKIKVSNNFSYDDNLDVHETYHKLKKITHACNNIRCYLPEIKDSHDVITFWMLFMNHEVGLTLLYDGVGIFRSTENKEKKCIVHNILPSLQRNIRKVFQGWNQDKAAYVLADDNKGHSLIGSGISAYAQCTSPIRRLVDIVNLTYLQIKLNMLEKTNALAEILNSIECNIQNIDYKMNSIKSVQNKCELLYKCTHISSDVLHEGYIISHEKKNDELNKYTIYIPSINIISYIKTNDILNFNKKGMYAIYVFEDEITLCKKIKLKKVS